MSATKPWWKLCYRRHLVSQTVVDRHALLPASPLESNGSRDRFKPKRAQRLRGPDALRRGRAGGAREKRETLDEPVVRLTDQEEKEAPEGRGLQRAANEDVQLGGREGSGVGCSNLPFAAEEEDADDPRSARSEDRPEKVYS
ncbi:unk2-141aa [Fowl aviadenovirus 4]|nr:unk2-141aa [Fowl aviadenovirus 4]